MKQRYGWEADGHFLVLFWRAEIVQVGKSMEQESITAQALACWAEKIYMRYIINLMLILTWVWHWRELVLT